MSSPRRWIVVSVVLAALASPAAAQTDTDEPATRAEQLRREREDKHAAVEPYEQNGVERAVHLAEKTIVPLLNRDGVYARFGSLTTGSAFAYGGGYRDRSLVGGRGRLDVWAAGSLKHYWSVEARGAYPLTADERVTLEGYARRYGYPEEEYFGLGPDSARSDQSVYNLHGSMLGADVVATAGRYFSLGGGVGHLSATADPATTDTLPSIDTIFDEDTAPGLGDQHQFVRLAADATFDYRQPINARKGGWYRVGLGRFVDREGTATTFTRVDVELRQYFSILAERRVFAARVRLATTEPDGDGDIPFFLLPTLGGNDTLRGFRANRFRGPHALLLQGEYRWEIWSGLDAALFVDAGKVADSRADLDFSDLESDYGFGFRFATDNGVIVRVDAAFGSRDGKHLHVVFGSIF